MPCFWSPRFLVVILGLSCRDRAITCRTWSCGLGEGDWDCLQHCGEGLWHHFGLLLFLNQEHHLCDPDHLVGESSLGHLAASLPHCSAEGNESMKWSGHGIISYFLRAQPNLVHPVGQPYTYVSLIVATAPHTVICCYGRAHWEPMSTPLGKCIQPLVEWLHQWNLWGSAQRGVKGPSLWLPLPVIFQSTFDTLSSSCRSHCGAGTPIRRVHTSACGPWSSLGVLSSIHWGRSDLSESCLQLSWNNQWVRQIPLSTFQDWQNWHNKE